MKRLPRAPLTVEDFEIKLGLRITYFGFPDSDLLCDIGDRQIEDAQRDADLMLQLRRWGFIRRVDGGFVFDLDPPRYL